MRPAELYELLFDYFGPQHWWPGDNPFEVAIGAILTQNTAWTNVERAIENLKNANMLEPGRIATAEPGHIQGLIRPSGHFRQKTGYLIDFCRHLMDHHGGSIERMLDQNLADARKELLALKGIGPETADSILLYAGNHPTFVVDAYTIRICRRIGILDSGRYDEVKAFFQDNLEPDVQLYNEYHALFVELGKNYCTARKPDCAGCPVRGHCDYSRTLEREYSPPRN